MIYRGIYFHSNSALKRHKKQKENSKMNLENITRALEHSLIKTISKGECFKIEYHDRIDLSKELKEVYKNIDYNKVHTKIKELLEEELAKKIVNKIVTEMGTDIKKLMCNNDIREDFKYLMRKGVESIMEKVKEEEVIEE